MEYESVTQPVLFFDTVQARWSTPHIRILLSRNFLTCVFLGAEFGVIYQFCSLRARPIQRRLISSCKDTLRELFTRLQ